MGLSRFRRRHPWTLRALLAAVAVLALTLALRQTEVEGQIVTAGFIAVGLCILAAFVLYMQGPKGSIASYNARHGQPSRPPVPTGHPPVQPARPRGAAPTSRPGRPGSRHRG